MDDVTWDPELGRRRCTAKSQRAGRRCLKAPIQGGTVCETHGGGAPQVKRAAALRLLDLVDPALATLQGAMADHQASWSDRLRAAADVLDRAGYPRGATLDVTGEQIAQQIRDLAAQLGDDG